MMRQTPTLQPRPTMLTWAFVFFVLALLAGFLGFGGIAFAAAGIAKLLFFLFVILFIGSLILRFTQNADRVADDPF